MAYTYRKKRKTTYRRRKAPVRRRTYVRRTLPGNLQLYVNPFAKVTVQPKIPDGKCDVSVGIPFQSRQELTMGDFNPAGTPITVGPSNDLIQLLFYPGMENTLVAYGTQLPEPPKPQDFRFADHVTWNDADGVIRQESLDQVAEWRTVSAGLHISLVNNAEENDGWWEAIRFQGNRDATSWNFDLQRNIVVPISAGSITPVISSGNEAEAGSLMVQNRSYSTGKLRDIHKVLFKLKANNTDHPFCKLRSQYIVNATGEAAIPGVNEQRNEMINALVDPSYDMMVIRIHGRAAGATPTRIRVHTRSNQELMYREGSKLARLHSSSRQSVTDAILKAANQAMGHAAATTVGGG